MIKAKPPESGDLYDVITEWGMARGNGIGTPKAETEGQSNTSVYATPTVIKMIQIFYITIVNVLWIKLYHIMSGV